MKANLCRRQPQVQFGEFKILPSIESIALRRKLLQRLWRHFTKPTRGGQAGKPS